LRTPCLIGIEHINRCPAGLIYTMPLSDGFGADDPASEDWHPMTLASWLERRRVEEKWFGSAEIVAAMRPVLDALQALSDAGLVHRDVKPDNVLFVEGAPCLGDIGLLAEDTGAVTRRGTPGYATPSWYADAGGHPDMYGAGATLYTLLTGNLPD